jgi:hypothetical protein
MRPLNSGLPEFSNIMSKSATADLDGADPESSTARCSGFRVLSLFLRPGMTVSGLTTCLAHTGQRFAQLRRGLTHVGDALLIISLEQVEVAAAERASSFVQANELPAAAAEAQQRRDAPGFSHGP